MQEKRRKIWIDRSQTKLMIRIGAYFVIMELTLIGSCILFEQFFRNVSLALGTDFVTFGLIFFFCILMLPAALFLYDLLKTAHRIVGPLYRFRKTLQAIASGQEVSFVRLRKGDYLLDFQDDMNRMIQTLADRGAVRLRSGTVCPAPSQPEVILPDAAPIVASKALPKVAPKAHDGGQEGAICVREDVATDPRTAPRPDTRPESLAETLPAKKIHSAGELVV